MAAQFQTARNHVAPNTHHLRREIKINNSKNGRMCSEKSKETGR